jgi:hypothetical protein
MLPRFHGFPSDVIPLWGRMEYRRKQEVREVLQQENEVKLEITSISPSNQETINAFSKTSFVLLLMQIPNGDDNRIIPSN